TLYELPFISNVSRLILCGHSIYYRFKQGIEISLLNSCLVIFPCSRILQRSNDFQGFYADRFRDFQDESQRQSQPRRSILANIGRRHLPAFG
ncbi:hypothetical protein, partial [Eikenella corrodens]|uniref:hypothetical protein n=1 Tax=Eikenella corrodens TaxID=539 RepID=UPI00195D55B0